MPSRPVAALIVLGWLAALGWFGVRELYPILFPSEAPPFVIDLGDEVTSQLGEEHRGPNDDLMAQDVRVRRRPDVLWAILRHDKNKDEDVRVGRAETRLRYYAEDNTFDLESRIVSLRLKSLVIIDVPEFYTAYRLNRRGEFLGMRVQGAVNLLFKESDPRPFDSGRIRLAGRVEGDKVIWEGEIQSGVLGTIKPEFEPIDAPKGAILNPLHPLPKIKYVRPGRRWRIPVVDPLGDALQPTIAAALKQFGIGQNLDLKKIMPRQQFLDAEVLNETADVLLNGVPHTCRIIEFRGEGSLARTFVRVTDGAVMRQEASTRGERIILQRE
jgi:hypothetical protein